MPWEEAENYIRSGHRNPDDFDPESFRTIDIDVEKGIKAIVAKPKEGDGMQVVSFLFDKNKGWTMEKAKEWFEKYLAAGAESFRWARDVFTLYKHVAEKEGAKIWKVRALHVGTTGNKTRFTEDELRLAARSLAWRPVNINHAGLIKHEKARHLPFPDNAVISAEYEDGTVEALVLISEPEVNRMIESGEINKASVEWVARRIDQVDGIEPHGLVFTGLALLTKDVQPGDPLTEIALKNKGDGVAQEPNSEFLEIMRGPLRHAIYPYIRWSSRWAVRASGKNSQSFGL